MGLTSPNTQPTNFNQRGLKQKRNETSDTEKRFVASRVGGAGAAVAARRVGGRWEGKWEGNEGGGN
jgi:hypothetical protein